MPEGPGKYDELCSYVREQAQAVGALVMIFGGNKGGGFGIQGPMELNEALPNVLRILASQLEKDAGVATESEGFNSTNLKDLLYICEVATEAFNKKSETSWERRTLKYRVLLSNRISELELSAGV